jgi:hypothetical protein
LRHDEGEVASAFAVRSLVWEDKRPCVVAGTGHELEELTVKNRNEWQLSAELADAYDGWFKPSFVIHVDAESSDLNPSGQSLSLAKNCSDRSLDSGVGIIFWSLADRHLNIFWFCSSIYAHLDVSSAAVSPAYSQ